MGGRVPLDDARGAGPARGVRGGQDRDRDLGPLLDVQVRGDRARCGAADPAAVHQHGRGDATGPGPLRRVRERGRLHGRRRQRVPVRRRPLLGHDQHGGAPGLVPGDRGRSRRGDRASDRRPGHDRRAGPDVAGHAAAARRSRPRGAGVLPVLAGAGHRRRRARHGDPHGVQR